MRLLLSMVLARMLAACGGDAECPSGYYQPEGYGACCPFGTVYDPYETECSCASRARDATASRARPPSGGP
jgi:hypothetical protein